jgi:hypothetical protein
MTKYAMRPPALAHISDEAAAKALSRHFGDFVQAACELNISRTDLRRLTWANPSILDAAHERMQLFIFVRKDEIISGLHSRRASDRRRAIDRIAANPGLFGDIGHSAFALLAPAARSRGFHRSAVAIDRPDEGLLARERLEQEAAAEIDREREREAAADRERESAVDRRSSAERGAIESAPARGTELPSGNAKYSGMRRLTRRR